MPAPPATSTAPAFFAVELIRLIQMVSYVVAYPHMEVLSLRRVASFGVSSSAQLL